MSIHMRPRATRRSCAGPAAPSQVDVDVGALRPDVLLTNQMLCMYRCVIIICVVFILYLILCIIYYVHIYIYIHIHRVDSESSVQATRVWR